jgi:hypothetical protein
MAGERKKYAVGYRKPPKSGQFQKGRSGNPGGRSKGSKNLSTLLGRTLAERVTVTENGQRRSITKLEAAVKQIVNKAASGDQQFSKQLLALVHVVEGRAEELAPPAPPLTDADRKVIEEIYRRITCKQEDHGNG